MPKKNAEFYEKSYDDSKWIFREVHQQSLTEMEELRKFQSSTLDTLARRKLIEDQNTILELSGRVQELQNEVNCINDSQDFQDAESVRSGNSHVTSRPVSFPTHPIPEGMVRPSFVSPRRKEGPPSIWDTHGISGNVFANPDASSSALYPQELHQWNSSIEEPLHSCRILETSRPDQYVGGWACYSVVFVFSHGLPVVCSGPRVQLFPPVFPARPPSNKCRRRLNLSVYVHNCFG